jgi:hypothetical protein
VEADAIQLHTFPTDDGGADTLRVLPPSYEEVVTTSNYTSTNAHEETEQPPTYEEVTLMDTLHFLYTNTSVAEGGQSLSHTAPSDHAQEPDCNLPKELGPAIVATVGINPIT